MTDIKLPLLYKEGDKFFKLEPTKTEVKNPGVAYVLGEGGLFYLNKNNAYEIVRKVTDDDNLGLDKVEEETSFSYPVISFDVYAKTLEFLRQVYETHRSEGAVMLVLNRNQPLENQEYKIYVPKQKVTGGSVDYSVEREQLQEGEFLAGSIHSHLRLVQVNRQ